MIHQSFWKPGSIVKLNEPYKVSRFGKASPGFTHGIIVQIIGHDRGEVSNVSLHLYNPEQKTIYVEDFAHGIPTYVDFHVSELTPWKDGDVTGYETVK